MLIREINKIELEETAYLLGFMFTDGCVSTSKNQKSNITYKTNISLQNCDNYILYKLSEIFEDFSTIVIKSRKNLTAMTSSKKEVYDKFLELGVLPRKSKENKENIFIPEINEDVKHHFIRGLLDGDGAIYFNNRSIFCEYFSTSSILINYFTNFFKNLGITFRIKVRKKEGHEDMYIAQCTKNSDIILIRNILYKNSTLFLKRKLETFNKINPLLKWEFSIYCPFCESTNILKSRDSYHKNYLDCLECNKKFNYTIKFAHNTSNCIIVQE